MSSPDLGGIVSRTVRAFLDKAADLEDVRDITLTANCYELHLDKVRDLCVGIPNTEYSSRET